MPVFAVTEKIKSVFINRLHHFRNKQQMSVCRKIYGRNHGIYSIPFIFTGNIRIKFFKIPNGIFYSFNPYFMYICIVGLRSLFNFFQCLCSPAERTYDLNFSGIFKCSVNLPHKPSEAFCGDFHLCVGKILFNKYECVYFLRQISPFSERCKRQFPFGLSKIIFKFYRIYNDRCTERFFCA